jgi:hypothetical protein
MVVACFDFLYCLYVLTKRTVFTVQHRINFSYKTVTAFLADKYCLAIYCECFIILPVHNLYLLIYLPRIIVMPCQLDTGARTIGAQG